MASTIGELTVPRQRGGAAATTPTHTPSAALALRAEAGSGHVQAVQTAGEVRPLAMWLRIWGLHVEVMTAFAVGLVAALLTAPQPYVGIVALATWLLGAFHGGQSVTTPLTSQLKRSVSAALLPMALVGAGVGFVSLPATAVPQAFTAVLAALGTSAVMRGLRWRLQAPVRVVVVGDRAAIATATARWARTDRVHVVGGLVVEAGLDSDAVPHEILGVPTARGLDDVKALVALWQADLVVVHPGAVTPEAFRRLTWTLDGDRVSIGVSGVLDAVAPHRITPGSLERSAIMDVRAPRPSSVVRASKSAFDRLAGAALLLVASPVLLAMVVAVRLDSKGPAFFAQSRVGRDGKLFKVYKMRTMVPDAEAIKSGLAEANEFDGVLFKMKRDPRITRVGSFLRKSSLDELPQLINVVKGDMSLVGPRPFVPNEVEQMDADTLRRHAVQPGITGLWQVSGRSDLGWDESAALDTYYADNWSFTGDLAIGLRTVKAVLAGKGAY